METAKRVSAAATARPRVLLALVVVLVLALAGTLLYYNADAVRQRVPFWRAGGGDTPGGDADSAAADADAAGADTEADRLAAEIARGTV